MEAVYYEKRNTNNGEDFMGLYRLKSYNTRFKVIEEAVTDLEEGFKLATETHNEMR
jgi:hypothetical protein